MREQGVSQGQTFDEAVATLGLTAEDVGKVLIFTTLSPNRETIPLKIAVARSREDQIKLLKEYGAGANWKTITDSDLHKPTTDAA